MNLSEQGMNRHQFEQAAKHFRAGRLTLSDFSDQMFGSKEAKIETGCDVEPTKLSPRKEDTHKGDFGRVLLVGGSATMPGAIGLTGLAALRSGSGLVVIATEHSVASTVASFSPCYMTIGLTDSAYAEQLKEYASWADVIGIGPGLGRSQRACDLVIELFENAEQPLVLDADALNCLADAKVDLSKHAGQRVLTPHPGEYRTLTGHSTTNRDAMVESTRELAKSNELVILLKGSRTFVTDGANEYVNQTGNPGMATGGSGDVLTGMVASLIGQGISGFDAARLGCQLHGIAGDLAAKDLGQVSLISSDLIDFLPRAFQSQS